MTARAARVSGFSTRRPGEGTSNRLRTGVGWRGIGGGGGVRPWRRGGISRGRDGRETGTFFT